MVKNWNHLLVEFVGTFFLVFAICFTANPLAVGLILAAMVYMGKHISGGHYNPAVSIAVWLRGKIKNVEVVWHIAAQCVGAFAAAAAFNFITSSQFTPMPLGNVNTWQAIVIEALFTFVLCMVVLTLTTHTKFNNNYIYGLAIGLTLTAIISCGGELSGGAFNPAVGIGPIFWNMVQGGSAVKYLPIYLVGPTIGGFLAAAFYNHVN